MKGFLLTEPAFQLIESAFELTESSFQHIMCLMVLKVKEFIEGELMPSLYSVGDPVCIYCCRENNYQKIQLAHYVITKRDLVFRGS